MIYLRYPWVAVAFIGLIVIIEYLATTTVSIQLIDSIWDKFKHVAAFFALTVMGWYGFRWNILWLMIFLVIFGMQIEIVQYFIPGRCFSLLDVIADIIGIALGLSIIYWLRYRKDLTN